MQTSKKRSSTQAEFERNKREWKKRQRLMVGPPRPSLMNPPVMRSAPEKKNTDYDTAATVVQAQATATVTLISGIAQSAADTDRVGRNVHMRSLYYRFDGYMGTCAGASPIRLLIVYDKQVNAALPATTSIVTVDSIESPMNLSYNKRFIVLVDETYPCLGLAGPQAFHMQGYRKLNLPQEFVGTTKNINSISTGAVYALVWQTGGITGAANPVTQLYTRIRFTDA